MTAIFIVLGIILLICLANSGSVKPKKSKAEVEKEFLWMMQHWQGQEDLDDIFSFYNDHTEYDLKNYPPFKSWYKTNVDHWLKYGNIRLKGGGEYKPEEDPLYDPDAPDWYDTYDIRYTYDDEFEDDDDTQNYIDEMREKELIRRMPMSVRNDYLKAKKRKSF